MNVLTNIVILSIIVTTNTRPGDGMFRRFQDTIVGIRSIEAAIQRTSLGYYEDVTNAVEVLAVEKLLWAKTNWFEFPIVIGVADQAPKLQSTPETIKPDTGRIHPIPPRAKRQQLQQTNQPAEAPEPPK